MSTKQHVHQLVTAYINATEHYRIGDECINLDETIVTSMPELYRFGLKEYGRCIGKIYIDGENPGKPMHVGYAFQKRVEYERRRSNEKTETYLQEVWLSIEHKIIETNITHLDPFGEIETDENDQA